MQIVGLWVWTLIFEFCPGGETLTGGTIVPSAVSIDRLRAFLV